MLAGMFPVWRLWCYGCPLRRFFCEVSSWKLQLIVKTRWIYTDLMVWDSSTCLNLANTNKSWIFEINHPMLFRSSLYKQPECWSICGEALITLPFQLHPKLWQISPENKIARQIARNPKPELRVILRSSPLQSPPFGGIPNRRVGRDEICPLKWWKGWLFRTTFFGRKSCTTLLSHRIYLHGWLVFVVCM